MPPVTRRLALALLLPLLLPLGLGGCIRSKAYITSEPPEAVVTWRGVERGLTPIEIPFIWYWYYDIEIAKEGYETLEVEERFRTPPWFLFPLDFVAEALPVPIPDTRRLHYELEPLPPSP